MKFDCNVLAVDWHGQLVFSALSSNSDGSTGVQKIWEKYIGMQ